MRHLGVIRSTYSSSWRSNSQRRKATSVRRASGPNRTPRGTRSLTRSRRTGRTVGQKTRRTTSSAEATATCGESRNSFSSTPSRSLSSNLRTETSESESHTITRSASTAICALSNCSSLQTPFSTRLEYPRLACSSPYKTRLKYQLRYC